MSRHIVRDDDEYEVVVGWDPPLQTFFAIVTDAKIAKQIDDAIAAGSPLDPEPDPIVWWDGASGEYRSLADLLPPLLPFVLLTDETLQQLAADQRNSSKPSPLQQHMAEKLRKLNGGDA